MLHSSLASAEGSHEARNKLSNTDWTWTSGAHDCEDILAAFAFYQRSNYFADRCLNLSAVVLELRLTVQFCSEVRLWPGWLLLTRKASGKCIPVIHGTDVDCGHAMLEVIVNLMNFAGAVETMRNGSACTAARDVQDSDESREWSAEDDNVWGNVLQRLLTALCQQRMHEEREDSVTRARRRLDIVEEMEEPPPYCQVMLSFHSAAAVMPLLCVLQYCLLFLTYFVAAQF